VSPESHQRATRVHCPAEPCIQLASQHATANREIPPPQGLLSQSAVADVVEGQATFVSEDKAIAFGFTVPDVTDDDFFFSIRIPKDYSWGAIGLGSEDMDGALVLMIYVCLLAEAYTLHVPGERQATNPK
jgi:hypothetical protein